MSTIGTCFKHWNNELALLSCHLWLKRSRSSEWQKMIKQRPWQAPSLFPLFGPNRCLFSIAHTGKNVQNIDMVKHKMETKIKFGTTTYTIVDSLKCCVLRQLTNQVSESRQWHFIKEQKIVFYMKLILNCQYSDKYGGISNSYLILMLAKKPSFTQCQR